MSTNPDEMALALEEARRQDRIKTAEINLLTLENRDQAERICQLIGAVVLATIDIERPADELSCHRGITSKEQCGRCSRAARIYAALIPVAPHGS